MALANPITVQVPFGGNPNCPLTIKSIIETPYLVIQDTNGAPILSLAVNPSGYVVHRAIGVNDGPNLEKNSQWP